MDLRTLKDTPPWDWPEDTGTELLGILRGEQAEDADRLLATELAGDFVVIDEELVEVLLAILNAPGGSEELRGTAATSLGPVLEHADMEGFQSPDDVPIAESTYHEIRDSLRALYAAPDTPQYVRRRVLEASVRAPLEWHQDAVREAYSSNDRDWRLTAVFSMRWVGGFDNEILEALGSDHDETRYQAVCAAANRELDEAWPRIAALVTSEDTEKSLLLAAIDAAATLRPEEAGMLVVDLADSEDEDVADAACDAMSAAEGR